MAMDKATDAVRDTAEAPPAAPSAAPPAFDFATLADHILLWERGVARPDGRPVDRFSILPPPGLTDALPARPEDVQPCLEILGGSARVFLGRAPGFQVDGRTVVITEITFLCPDIADDRGVVLWLQRPDGTGRKLVLSTDTLPSTRVLWRDEKARVSGEIHSRTVPVPLVSDLSGVLGQAGLPPDRPLDVALYPLDAEDEGQPLRIGPAQFRLHATPNPAAQPFRADFQTTTDDAQVRILVSRTDGAPLDPRSTDAAALAAYLVKTQIDQFHYRRHLAADPRLSHLATLSDQVAQPRLAVTSARLIGLFADLLRALFLAMQEAGGEGWQLVKAVIEKAAEGDEQALAAVRAAVERTLAPDGGQTKTALVSVPFSVSTLDSIRLRPDGAPTAEGGGLLLGPTDFLPTQSGGSDAFGAAATAAGTVFRRAARQPSTRSLWQALPAALRTRARVLGSDPLPMAPVPGRDTMTDRINTDYRRGQDPFARVSPVPVLCNPIPWLLDARQRQGGVPVAGLGAAAFDNLVSDSDSMAAVVKLVGEGAPAFLLDLIDADLAALADPRSPAVLAILGSALDPADVITHFAPRPAGDATALSNFLRLGVTQATLADLGVTDGAGLRGLLDQTKAFLALVAKDAAALPDPPEHDLDPPLKGLSLPAVKTRTTSAQRITNERTWPRQMGQKADAALAGVVLETMNQLRFLRELYPDRGPFNDSVTLKALRRFMSKNVHMRADPAILTETGNDLARVWAIDDASLPEMMRFVAWLHERFNPGDAPGARVEAFRRAIAEL